VLLDHGRPRLLEEGDVLCSSFVEEPRGTVDRVEPSLDLGGRIALCPQFASEPLPQMEDDPVPALRARWLERDPPVEVDLIASRGLEPEKLFPDRDVDVLFAPPGGFGPFAAIVEGPVRPIRRDATDGSTRDGRDRGELDKGLGMSDNACIETRHVGDESKAWGGRQHPGVRATREARPLGPRRRALGHDQRAVDVLAALGPSRVRPRVPSVSESPPSSRLLP